MSDSEKPKYWDWEWGGDEGLSEDYFAIGHWVFLPLAAVFAATIAFLWSWGAGISIENLVFMLALLIGGLVPLVRRFLKR